MTATILIFRRAKGLGRVSTVGTLGSRERARAPCRPFATSGVVLACRWRRAADGRIEAVWRSERGDRATPEARAD